MNKKSLFDKYIYSYEVGLPPLQKWGVSMKDGQGGKIRKKGFHSYHVAHEWLKFEHERNLLSTGKVEMTFMQFCYLVLVKEKLEKRPATPKRYEGLLKEHFFPFFGDLPVHKIQIEIANEFKEWLLKKEGISGTTRNLAFATFKQAYKIAAGRGLVNDLRVLTIKSPPRNKRETNVWSEEEMHRFFEHPVGKLNRYYHVWKLAALTGLRSGEIRALKWRDVNLDEKPAIMRVLRTRCQQSDVLHESTKNGDVRVVCLSEDARELLKELRTIVTPITDDADIFPALDPKHFSRELRKDCKRVGVTSIRFHDLRHTYATLLTKKGAESRLVGMQLGHRDAKTTERYVHKNEETQKALWLATFVARKVPATE